MSESPSNQRRTFYGVNFCGIDSQRRLVMPKSWRLDSDSGLTQFYLVPAFPDVVKLYDQLQFDRFRNMLDTMDDTDPDILEGLSLVGSLTSVFTPDRQGRFTVPQEIIDFGHLGSKVVMVGAINYGRLVSQDRWMQCGQNLTALLKLEQSISAERKRLCS